MRLANDSRPSPLYLSGAKIWIYAFLIALVLWALLGAGVYYFRDDWPERGQFGDMFGAANALFSALAFSGLVIAILFQTQELQAQREQLALQRAEMEFTREILSLTAELNAFMTWDRSSHNIENNAAFDELVKKLKAAREKGQNAG